MLLGKLPNSVLKPLCFIERWLFLFSDNFSLSNLKELAPWLGAGLAVAYAVHVHQKLKKRQLEIDQFAKGQINTLIRKEDDKVVDTVFVEDLGDKKSLCRCWKSKKVRNSRTIFC